MSSSLPTARILLCAGQCALPLACLVAIACTPPVQGRLLLVPISASARDALIVAATEHGARLVGRGPIGGSMIVDGARARLAIPMLARGIVPLRAWRGGCGDEQDINA